jgi:amidohydrolase
METHFADSRRMKQDSEDLLPVLIDLRRDFHRHPELSFREFRTAGRVASILRELGMEVREKVGGTGVIGLLRGLEGPSVAIRADMDALPVTEKTGLPFASETEGMMHACGHDIHTACLLGTAMLLASRRDSLPGTVKFLFQPAEEINRGARAMIEDGALDCPVPEMIFGLHNHPELPAGTVGVREGPLMASVDTISVRITGKGGHGALPHRDIDPITGAAAVISALQTVVSRSVDPREPAVVSLGTIHGGTANNVIPDTVEMTGTVRTFSEEVRGAMEGMIRRVVGNTAAGLGCRGELAYRYDLPPVMNAPEPTEIARLAVKSAAGADALVTPVPSMGGEDFALFQEKIPGCFLWLGVGNPEAGTVYPWHSPFFAADENSLSAGAAVLAQSALLALERLSAKSLR